MRIFVVGGFVTHSDLVTVITVVGTVILLLKLKSLCLILSLIKTLNLIIFKPWWLLLKVMCQVNLEHLKANPSPNPFGFCYYIDIKIRCKIKLCQKNCVTIM